MAKKTKPTTKKTKKGGKSFQKLGHDTVYNTVKSRYTTNGKANIANIISDVATLKNLMNVEKKRIDYAAASSTLGQLTINNTGAVFLDITPVASQGVAYNQRTGASLKVVSAISRFQFWSQANCNHATRCIIEYFKVKGATQNVGTFINDYYNVNPNSGVIDYQSNKDPDYFGQATCFYKKEFTVPAPSFSGEIVQKEIVLPMRLQHHVRFDQNSTTVDDGQIIMIMRADSGNTSTLSTQSNCPVLTATSALIFNFDHKWYFVDN